MSVQSSKKRKDDNVEDIKFQRSIFVCIAMFVIGILISSNILSTNTLQADDDGYEIVDSISQVDAESLGTSVINNIGIGEMLIEGSRPLENASDELNQSGFTFILDDTKEIAIVTGDTRVVDIALDLVIPSEVTYNGQEYTVAAIGDSAFSGSGLGDLYIPDSVIDIGDYAFYNTGLNSVTIGNSVETIGISAFADNQLTEVYIPVSTTAIGGSAFANNQIDSVELGIVETIGDLAFAWNQIQRVSIPNSVTYIGKAAFTDNELVGITIGDSVTYIGSAAFANNELDWSVIGDSVTYIGSDAFADNDLSLVMFGGAVETIGDSAFADNQLSNIALPDSLVTVGEGAFERNQIENIIIGDSLDYIGTAAFQNNELTDVYFSDSPVTVGEAAFANNELTQIRIPQTVDFPSGDRWHDSDVDMEMNLNSAFSGNQLQTIYVDEGDATRLMPLIGIGILNTTGDVTIISEEGSRYGSDIELDNDVEIGDDLVLEAASQVRYVFDNEQRLEGLDAGLWADHSPDVQWYLDEVPLSDETDLILELDDIQIADEGEYSVVVDGERLPAISVNIIGERIISELSIDDITGEVNQDATTITFNVPEDYLDNDGSFSGYITELEALTDTVIFADDQDQALELGDSVNISSNNTVRVEGGRVYTIVVEQLDVPTITSLAIADVTGEIDQDAETITFTVDEDLLSGNDTFSGNITTLEASSNTILINEEAVELGDTVSVSTGDSVYVEDGIVYTVDIEVIEAVEEDNEEDGDEEESESATEAETLDLIPDELTEPTAITDQVTEPATQVPATESLPTEALPTTIPPTTAPPATVPPTTAPPAPSPAPAGSSNWGAGQWRDYGRRYVASSLPNRRLSAAERSNWIAEYNRLGGHSAFDREVVRLINNIRSSRGLSTLSIDNSLMMSARFYTQTMSNFNSSLGHNNGPYRIQGASHGASQNIAAAFGVSLRWNGGNAAATGNKHTPQSLVNAWMNSPAHSAYILSPGHRVIGSGFYLGGSGSPWGAYYYLFMN